MEQYPMFHLSCGVTISHLCPQYKKTEIPNASSKALRRWGRWRGCVFMRTCANLLHWNHWPLLQRCSCLEWFGVDHFLRKLVQLCKTGRCLRQVLTFFWLPEIFTKVFTVVFPTSHPQINHFEGEIWMVPCPNFHPGHFGVAIHPPLWLWFALWLTM